MYHKPQKMIHKPFCVAQVRHNVIGWWYQSENERYRWPVFGQVGQLPSCYQLCETIFL